jgi:hypothetical protein
VLQLIRNNNPFTVLVLLIFTVLSRLWPLLHPVAPVPEEGLPLYNLVLRACDLLLRGSAFGYTLLALVLIFFQALYLNVLVIRHRLFPRPAYIPAYCYLLLTAVHPEFSYFTSLIFVNWCLLGAFDMMLRFSQPAHPRKQIYNAGLLVGLGTLFHFSAVAFVLLFLAALLLLRPFNAGEWVVALLGIFTPLYFMVGLLFLADADNVLPHWVRGLVLPSPPAWSLYTFVLIVGTLVLAGSGLLVMRDQAVKSTIHVRRAWTVVVFGCILSVPAALFAGGLSSGAWIMATPALSLVIAHPLYLERNRKYALLTAWGSLVFLVFCQLTFNR